MPDLAEPATLTIRESLNLALDRALAEDPNVILIGEDIADPMGGSFKVTQGLSTKYGTDRVRNTPISEGAIVGSAVGAALAGLRPVAEIMYQDFATVAMDQLVNQAALISYMSGGQLSVPAVFRTQGGAWRSSAAQHSKSLESWFTHVPGLKYYVPTDAQDAYWLLLEAIADPNPVLFYEPNLLYQKSCAVDTSRQPATVTGAKHLRQGRDLTLVTWGYTRLMTCEAADALDGDGISADVWALRSLAPLDLGDIAESVSRTGLLMIVHEAWESGGLGAEIAARAADELFYYLDGPIRRVGAQHAPHPFSPTLERAMMPSVERIVAAAKDWFQDR